MNDAERLADLLIALHECHAAKWAAPLEAAEPGDDKNPAPPAPRKNPYM